MNSGKVTALTASILLLLSGCSDQRTASKANFKAAIQAYFDTRPGACVSLPDREIPFRVSLRPMFNFHPSTQERADALVAVGLLTSAPAPKRPFVRDPEIEYQLTPAGSKVLVKGPQMLGYSSDAFCTGKYRVKDILNFTEPADMLGSRVSHVTHSYILEGAADWARSPQLLEMNPKFKEEVNGTARQDTLMVLRNDGWIDARAKGL